MSWGAHVYVATRYVDKATAAAVASQLRRAGARVTSSWHDGAQQPGDEQHLERRRAIAEHNLTDLRAATACLVLAHPDLRGGLVELALAWSWGKRVVAVGARTDLTLMVDVAGVEWVATVDEAIARLGAAT